jgi:hypothetical protein
LAIVEDLRPFHDRGEPKVLDSERFLRQVLDWITDHPVNRAAQPLLWNLNTGLSHPTAE